MYDPLIFEEATPPIYRSRVASPSVAWSLRFREHRLVAASAGAKSSVQNAMRRNPNAAAVANGTAAMQSMPNGFDYLMIYVPLADHACTHLMRNGFQVTDVIGTEPSWFERWMTRITGR